MDAIKKVVPASDIDPETLDLLILLPSLLCPNGEHLNNSDTEILSSDLQVLLENASNHLPTIADLVSQKINSQAMDLARVKSLANDPYSLHRNTTRTPARVAKHTQQHTQQHNRQSLTTSHASTSSSPSLSLSSEVSTMTISQLQLHSHTLPKLIRTLETKNGIAARNMELRAHDACLCAEGVRFDASVLAERIRNQVYYFQGTGDYDKQQQKLQVATALQRYSDRLTKLNVRARKPRYRAEIRMELNTDDRLSNDKE